MRGDSASDMRDRRDNWQRSQRRCFFVDLLAIRFWNDYCEAGKGSRRVERPDPGRLGEFVEASFSESL